MRILFVLGGLRVGGYEILSVKVANRLARDSNKLGILSLSGDVGILDRVDPSVATYVAKRSFKFDISILLKIALVLRWFKPDIILSCSFFEYSLVRLTSLFVPGGRKHLLAFHQTKPYDKKEHRWNMIFSLLTRLFNDKYIAIHTSQVTFYSENYGLPADRFTLIHNGVDTRFFTPVDGETVRRDGILRIAHVANLKPLKDQMTLLKAVAELNKTYRNWQLTLVGEDQSGLLEEYEAFLRQNNIARKVSFVGAVSDTRRILADSDVFVLTSVTEALPVSVIEATAMGLPCIVTDVGGNPDIIENDIQGFVVKPGDYRAISHCLKYLVDNPLQRKRMGIAARQKTVAQFDLNKMVSSYSDLFKSVLSV